MTWFKFSYTHLSLIIILTHNFIPPSMLNLKTHLA